MSGVCTLVDAGLEQRSSSGSTRRALGEHFEIIIAEVAPGDSSGRHELDADKLGEEVATVLAGEFEVVTDDEQYRLSSGEAIIIPPGVKRTWRSLEKTGSLYRAITRVGTG
jgi:quercetin dioxygenase-like cupin family protein